MSKYYKTCCDNIGRPVLIRTLDGQEHPGIIRRVTPSHVYLEPFTNQPRGLGSSYYYGQPYPRYPVYRPGFGLGIALGAIGTLSILPWFFI